ncbi:MAG: glycosyltransferase family 2 protein [Candidatus Delongbacteria bacterium]|jgi:glycosyltransferase involved in cell wall biosynthesis|nr:glycosyltransferase family 2 protein [Candidatus Delongbacteria bacterium]
MENLTIIIPAFNEESGIGETLKILEPYANKNSWKVFVVNDGSLDKTKNIVAELDFVELLNHKVNRGYGASLKTGINNCKTKYLAFYDADGQHKPEDLERLWTEYDDEDMIVGQRIKGSHISVSRTPGKFVLSMVANFLSGQKIPDLNSGLRIVKRDIIEKYLHLFPDGFSFSTTSTIALLSNRHVVSYKPIQTNKRIGKSSVNQFRDGFNTILLILRLIVLFNPLKVFLPSSFFLLFVGTTYEIIWGYILSPHLRLLPGALMTILTGIIIFFFALIMDQISQLRKNSIQKN